MTRVVAAVLVTAAGVTTLLTHHHRRPTHPSSATGASGINLTRASRFEDRPPLRPSTPSLMHSPGQGATPRLRRRGPSRPAGPAALLDVTAYCATGSRTASGTWPQLGDVAVLDRRTRFGTRLLIDGNVYTVTDWIGHGSDVDIYMGAGAVCEQRAAAWGRRRLRVVTVTR